MMYLIGMLIGFIFLIVCMGIDNDIKQRKEENDEKVRIEEENNIVINIGDNLEISHDGKISIYTLNKLFNLQPSCKFFMDGYIDQIFRSYIVQGIYFSYTYTRENTPANSSSRMLDKEDVIMLFLTIEGYEDEKKYVLDEMNKKIEKINNREFEFEQIRKEKIKSIKEQLDSKFDESDIKELKNKLN